MNRAYSILTVKSVDENKRVIRGVATTPETDRQGDIVESLGVVYKNPLPLLWMHQTDKPVGLVKFDKPTKSGINFEATLPNVTEPGALKDRVDEAWHSVQHKLVRAVSIGFRALEYAFMEDGGTHFQKSEILELSLVVVPANESATIQSVKSLDKVARAASGRTLDDDEGPTPPAPGKSKTSTLPVKAQERKQTMKKSIAEQISAFSATREAKSADMDVIMDTAAEKGETLDADGKEKYDTLLSEVKEIDDHIVRLKAAEERSKAAAVPVVGELEPGCCSPRRQSRRHHAACASQGLRLRPSARCALHGKEENIPAYQIAESKGWGDEIVSVLKMPNHILKSAIAAGSTTDSTWAGPLVTYNNLQEEFIELLRPNALISKIPGLRRVPFNIKVPRETTTMTAYWVGQGSPKPVSKGALDTVTLDFAKIAGITYQTQELLRFSRPNSEGIMVNSLTKAIQYLMDRDFLDPSKAVATGVSPASITNGSTSITATGITSDAFRADFRERAVALHPSELQLG
jgi:HK97 family phage major capsid protein/HK97 family phage prohead protease